MTGWSIFNFLLGCVWQELNLCRHFLQVLQCNSKAIWVTLSKEWRSMASFTSLYSLHGGCLHGRGVLLKHMNVEYFCLEDVLMQDGCLVWWDVPARVRVAYQGGHVARYNGRADTASRAFFKLMALVVAGPVSLHYLLPHLMAMGGCCLLHNHTQGWESVPPQGVKSKWKSLNLLTQVLRTIQQMQVSINAFSSIFHCNAGVPIIVDNLLNGTFHCDWPCC